MRRFSIQFRKGFPLFCGFNGLVSLFVFSLLFVLTTAEVGLTSVPLKDLSESVTGRVTAQNGFAWKYGYDIELTDNALLIRVGVNLVPAGGVTRLELDRAAPSWEAGIESVWNDAFELVTPAGKRYPIIVDVSFKGPQFHHSVIVRPGRGRSDELNWHLLDSRYIAAHEFGHMLGAFDEYRGGGTDPIEEKIDTTSIMTRNPSAGVTYERHYERLLNWFKGKTGIKDCFLRASRESVITQGGFIVSPDSSELTVRRD